MQTRQRTLLAQKQQFCFIHPQNKIFHERYAQAAQKYNSKILSPLMLSGRKTKYVIHADKRILKSCGSTATRGKTSLAAEAPVLEASEIFCNLETIFFNVPRYQSRNWLVNRSPNPCCYELIFAPRSTLKLYSSHFPKWPPTLKG